MEELQGMSSEKLNAVVDEATRDSLLDKIRRISFMNGNNDVSLINITHWFWFDLILIENFILILNCNQFLKNNPLPIKIVC